MSLDALIIGGGPAGLSAALALGRARRRVLLCDAGPRRNAAAVHMHNFVTRDGMPPGEFRAVARAQLAEYPNVVLRDAGVRAVEGEAGAFAVRVDDGTTVEARRIVLATGMIDELPALEGFAALWGRAIFQCPYCHGWEVRGRRFAWLPASPEDLGFALLLRGWTDDLVVLTDGRFAVPDDRRARLDAAGVAIEERPLRRLVGADGALAHVELADGTRVARDVLFAHPPQRQVALVQALGVALDDQGFVQIDPMTRETSVAGIHAAGDLAAPAQGGQSAVLSAAAGMRAAAMVHHRLVESLVFPDAAA